MKEKILNSEYTVEVDQINKDDWSKIIQNFSDATIYQTWSYGSVRWGENNLSHLVLKKNKQIVSAAQLRILKFPAIPRGIAYIRWGPIGEQKGVERDPQTFCRMIRALKEEYVIRRKLFLRVIPNEIENGTNQVNSLFESEGFISRPFADPYRTLLLDLSPSAEELRKNFKKSWRKNLNQAEKNGLTIKTGTNGTLFEEFIGLYKEMHQRKNFAQFVDIDEFKALQEDLPEPFKMKIMVCKSQHQPVSAIVWSELGNTAMTLLSATGQQGLNLNSSYLLRWQMLQQLQERGYHYLDQNGIDPEGNPGTYNFKKGFGGEEVKHIGCFDACQSWISSSVFKFGEYIRSTQRKLKIKMNK